MNVRLLLPDRDYDPKSAVLPPHCPDLEQDLALEPLFAAMAGGDEFLRIVARSVVLSAMANDPAAILHRQAVLRDCLREPVLVRAMYDLTVETA